MAAQDHAPEQSEQVEVLFKPRVPTINIKLNAREGTKAVAEAETVVEVNRNAFNARRYRPPPAVNPALRQGCPCSKMSRHLQCSQPCEELKPAPPSTPTTPFMTRLAIPHTVEVSCQPRQRYVCAPVTTPASTSQSTGQASSRAHKGKAPVAIKPPRYAKVTGNDQVLKAQPGSSQMRHKIGFGAPPCMPPRRTTTAVRSPASGAPPTRKSNPNQHADNSAHVNNTSSNHLPPRPRSALYFQRPVSGSGVYNGSRAYDTRQRTRPAIPPMPNPSLPSARRRKVPLIKSVPRAGAACAAAAARPVPSACSSTRPRTPRSARSMPAAVGCDEVGRGKGQQSKDLKQLQKGLVRGLTPRSGSDDVSEGSLSRTRRRLSSCDVSCESSVHSCLSMRTPRSRDFGLEKKRAAKFRTRLKHLFGVVDDGTGRAEWSAVVELMRKLGVVKDNSQWKALSEKVGVWAPQDAYLTLDAFSDMIDRSDNMCAAVQNFYRATRNRFGAQRQAALPLSFLVDVYAREMYLMSIMSPTPVLA